MSCWQNVLVESYKHNNCCPVDKMPINQIIVSLHCSYLAVMTDEFILMIFTHICQRCEQVQKDW